MKVRVDYRTPQITVAETFEGGSAKEIVGQMQRAAARKAGFAMGFVINAMPPMQFALEVTRRYAEAVGRPQVPPGSCDAFIAMGVREGIFTIISP